MTSHRLLACVCLFASLLQVAELKSSHQVAPLNHNDIQQPQQQRQQNRAPISGYHATYVTPPADFKPIIYEPDDSWPGLLAAASSSQEQASGDSMASSNQLGPQQQQQQPAKVPAATQANSVIIDDIEAPPLKPAIGRWSEWYDMSIEPDLASSESAAAPEAAAVRQKQLYRTRYGQQAAGGSGSGSESRRRSETTRIQAKTVSDVGGLSDGAAKQAHVGLSSPLAADHVGAARREHRQPQQQQQQLHSPMANGAYNMQQQQQQPAWKSIPSDSYFDSQLPSEVPLGGAMRVAAGPPLGTQQFNQLQHQAGQMQWRQQQQQQPIFMVPPAYVSFMPPAPAPAQWRSKFQRRLHAAAPSGQHSASSKSLAAKSSKGKSELVGASEQSRKIQLQNQVNGAAARLIMPANEGAGRRATDKQQQQQQSVAPARRLGDKMQPQQQPTAKTATSPTPKRVLRRRRIKTMLPVGLTSWFLGGIRDLDGRHWNLPADVMSKLAVNDVDLHHHHTEAAAGAQPDDGVELVADSLEVEQPRASTNAPREKSTSQLAPR